MKQVKEFKVKVVCEADEFFEKELNGVLEELCKHSIIIGITYSSTTGNDLYHSAFIEHRPVD